jgi:2-polyprenyl-6-methoxyphenol hydroxylase-like FAD-dependent oxidoreductase
LSQLLNDRESVRDAGDWHVLRRYERARAEPILAMDALVDGLYRLFGAQSGFAARLRNTGLNLTNRLAVVKNALIRQAMN